MYISGEDQQIIKNYKIFLAGCGIGSNIAECALRIGFERQTLVDGDFVEISNLNRQNYILQNIGCNKSESLRNRLLSINPSANVDSMSLFLNTENIKIYLPEHDIAVNALDFQTDVPFQFDKLCQEEGIPVLHPYNFGWGSLIFVIMPASRNLSYISEESKGFERKVASFLIDNITGNAKYWVKDVLQRYEESGKDQSPPQLSIGSWLAAGACTNIMYLLATGKPVKVFPEFYFITTEQ